jgi:adenylylsulfate kinase
MLIILMTGLSGAGKTTLAEGLQSSLTSVNIAAEVIDGDAYRKTLNSDLGFSALDRRENIQRLATVANEKKARGVVAIVSAINPFEDQRVELSKKYGAKIIWIKCSLTALVARDPKGLYRKALLPNDHREKLWDFTGINAPYEMPVSPDFIVDTSNCSKEISTQQLFNYVKSLLDFSQPDLI